MFICKTLHGCAVTDYDKFDFMYSVRKFLASLFSFSACSSIALIALCIKSLIFDLFFLIFSILYVIILILIIHFDLER